MDNDLLFPYGRNLEDNQLSGTIPTQLSLLSQNGLLESKYVLFQNSVLDNALPLCLSHFFTTICGMAYYVGLPFGETIPITCSFCKL